jgi:hypothetical protein
MPRGYETKAQTLGATAVPKVLTLEEIAYMERTYPDAVAAARICGYDAVEFRLDQQQGSLPKVVAQKGRPDEARPRGPNGGFGEMA